ncbi:hypothetical protein [Herbaspirillum sp. NPDC087042]|uniref:hypothetical protein n=1 Tax=Herbaspirillum sp. NPDC087042 TaxID=3364004 RepID=UPI0037F4D5F1
MTIKNLVRQACPEAALRLYRQVKEHVAPARMAAPVVQMYINDGHISTVAGINNYLSFLNAGLTTAGRLAVVLRDKDGVVLLEQELRLEHFGNSFLDIHAMLARQSLSSDLGLISMQFTPDRVRLPEYKKLGLLASHFFMFYKGAAGGVAMVHPSSTLDPASPPSGPFITNQVIETTGLEAVTLYQCNPSAVMHEMVIGLQDAQTKAVACSEVLRLPPLSVRKVSFVANAAFAGDGRPLRVFTSSLPTSNSKPMLCRQYSGQRFSMSHS